MCGAVDSELYSVWIGKDKVISREERADKCDPNPVRAIFYDGHRLKRCGGALEERASKGRASCTDISAHLRRPARDAFPLNSFMVAFAAPGQRAFCQSLIRPLPKGAVVSDWPPFTAEPQNTLSERDPNADDPNDIVWRYDLNNSGRPQQVIQITQASHFFDGDFLAIPPKGVGIPEARARLAQISDHEEFEAARRLGYQLFAGDQTPYRELRYVRFLPFRRAGQTWLHARWGIPRLGLPSEIVTRPMPNGSQKLVCRFQETPAF